MPRYTNILYWKWDYSIFEENSLENKLMDIIQRSDFEFLYVSFHHIKYPFSDPRMLDLVRRCNSILTNAGRKLLLDIDARNEGEEFDRAYPGHKGFYTRFLEFSLDADGNGSIELKNLPVSKVGRKVVHDPPEFIVNSWAFTLADPSHFYVESLQNIKANTILEKIDEYRTKIRVAAGPQNGNKKVLIYPAIRHAIPDLFSPNLYNFYSTMFEHVQDLNLGGTATDEWGYELALQCEGDRYYSEHFPYSPFMAQDYKVHTGRDMAEDMLYFLYEPADQTGLGIRAVSSYLEVLRAKLKENNEWFYHKSKEVFGPETFIGVHPTFWGDATDFYLDVILNGLDWWEVKRDYAQTDEWVLYPIRLALAHKWGGKVWYNMWYSGNTNIKETFFEETWTNARFGGRTHYLGYECIPEPGVLTMSKEGVLEEMDAMESEIKKINEFQTSQPDSRVLVIFGMEAVSCWNICAPGARSWERNGGILNKVLKYTKKLFDNPYLCDLIPSSEIVNGSLKLEDGRARYGTQTYDAVIFLLPDGMRKEAFQFLKDYYEVNKNLIVVGDCSLFSDGDQAAGDFAEFAEKLEHHLHDIENVMPAIEILKKWEVPAQVYDNGCVYQDGSMIFTTNGEKNVGNHLTLDTEVSGHRVEFDGDDFMAIHINGNGRLERFAAGKCNRLKIDGQQIS